MPFRVFGCVEVVADPDDLKDFSVTICKNESSKMSVTSRL